MSTLSVPVQTRAVQALRQSSHPALRSLTVQETEESIIIFGRVKSYYLKQLAQETVADLDGVDRIDNQIQVVTPTLSVTSGLTVEPSRHENHAVIFALRGVF